MSKERIHKRGVRSIHNDRRGAVLVEFIVALMPLLITFFSFVQLAQIVVAHLMVKHATIIGARAAAVISNGKCNTPDQKQGKNDDEIKKAVEAGLGIWKSDEKVKSFTVEIDDQSSWQDPYGAITVKVDADFNCRVPLGRLICGTGTHKISQKFGFPHQGARYAEGDGATESCNASGGGAGGGGGGVW